jgi:hypothetical protein
MNARSQKAITSREEEAKKWRTEAERLERLGSTADKEMKALRFEIKDREDTIHERVRVLLFFSSSSNDVFDQWNEFCLVVI